MMRAFEETAAAQVEIDKLDAQMLRLGLQQETLSDRTLDEVRKMFAKAGMKFPVVLMTRLWWRCKGLERRLRWRMCDWKILPTHH